MDLNRVDPRFDRIVDADASLDQIAQGLVGCGGGRGIVQNVPLVVCSWRYALPADARGGASGEMGYVATECTAVLKRTMNMPTSVTTVIFRSQ